MSLSRISSYIKITSYWVIGEVEKKARGTFAPPLNPLHSIAARHGDAGKLHDNN